MYIDYEALSIGATTSTDVVTSYTSKSFQGLLHCIQYVASTSTPWSTANNIAITGERTGLTFLNVPGTTGSTRWFPRGVVVTTTGGSTSGDSPLIPVFDERFLVTLTSGSTSGGTTGTLRFFVI